MKQLTLSPSLFSLLPLSKREWWRWRGGPKSLLMAFLTEKSPSFSVPEESFFRNALRNQDYTSLDEIELFYEGDPASESEL